MDETLANSWKQVEQIVRNALAEDLSFGDATTDAIIPPDLEGRATILAKGEGVLAGIEVASEVFLQVDPSIQFETLVQDSANVQKKDVVAAIEDGIDAAFQAA